MEQKLPLAWLARSLSGLALWSSKNAKLAVTLVVLLTLVLGFGVTKLDTNVDVAEVLPRGDYNTTAAQQLTREFKSAFTLQVTLQFTIDHDANNWSADNDRLLPNRRSPETPGNITDEVYVRAMQQFTEFFVANSNYSNVISLAELYSLINWTIAGGANETDPAPDSAYRLPATDPDGSIRYEIVRRGADAAILSALDAVSSPNWTTSAVLIMPNADETLDMADLGLQAIETREKYLEWAEGNPEAFKVFTGDNKPLFTVELPIANAHSSELVREDFSRLLPIIGVFIFACLLVAFRNVIAALIGFASLLISVLWTYGVEGYMGIALNSLNLTLMPLIMGIGIDYAIHVVNEFLEHKKGGLTDQRAFQETGRRAGVALAVATVTTVAGLLVMVISPSVLIAEFGALAALSITAMFLVSLIFIPAALTLYRGTEKMGASFRPSEVMGHVARGIFRARWVALSLVVVASVVGTVAATNTFFESFGDPGRNYLRTDPVRMEHEAGLQAFYETFDPDVKANVLVFVGDVTTPASHDYMRGIEASLRNPPPQYRGAIIGDTLRTIPFLMETWLTVKDGGPGALQYLGVQELSPGSTYPDTQAEIRAEFDALYASPMRQLGSIFTNGPQGDYSLGVMTFSAKADNFTEAVGVWEAVWYAVAENEPLKPDGLELAMVGNTATNYLFVEKEVPWVLYMGTISTFFLMAIAAPVLRSWKAIVTVGLISFSTTAIWLGVLPSFDIGLAITLVLPLTFIIAMGTDYVVHILWSNKVVKDMREVFRTTGKAVLFSFLTTLGPFIIFLGIQDLAVRKTMLATALAISMIFIITVLVIPAMYYVRPREPKAKAAEVSATIDEPVIALKRPKAASR